MKVVSQPARDAVNNDQNAPSSQTVNDNKSLDNIRKSSFVSKADTLSSLHSGSSHHAASAPPTPQVFLISCFL